MMDGRGNHKSSTRTPDDRRLDSLYTLVACLDYLNYSKEVAPFQSTEQDSTDNIDSHTTYQVPPLFSNITVHDMFMVIQHCLPINGLQCLYRHVICTLNHPTYFPKLQAGNMVPILMHPYQSQ